MDSSAAIAGLVLDPEPLPRGFFARPTLEVAPDLIGKTLVTRRGSTITAGRIVEVEAYLDARDLASHASKGSGPTRRNAAMYGPPGHAYVYRIYGMHHCFNVVTERDGVAGAVLIRALEPIAGLEVMERRRRIRSVRELASGPGKLCVALGIDRDDDGLPLDRPGLRIVAAAPPRRPIRIERSPRIGVDYAGAWAAMPFRFFVAGSEWISNARRRRDALP